MDLRKKLDGISIGELCAVVLALVYVTGYLISALYVRSRGINEMSLVSSQYIETGLVFILLTALFVAVPLVIMNMSLDSRRRHGYPNLVLSLVFPVVTSNYLCVFTFFCLFVTRYEWLLRFKVFGLQTGLIQCFAAYTILLFVFQILFMFLKYDGKKPQHGVVPNLNGAEERPILMTPFRKWAANFAIGASLLVTGWFDYILFRQVKWFPMFMSRASAYIFCIVLIVVVGVVVARLARVYVEGMKRWKFWFIGGFVALVLYYFAISSYEFGVYINIPMSRGGRYPVTRTTLYFKQDSTHAKKGEMSRSVYVVEETGDRYYVVPTNISNWFQDHPSVEGISKSEVAYPHYDHLKTGEPRINHLKAKEGGQPGTNPLGSSPAPSPEGDADAQ